MSATGTAKISGGVPPWLIPVVLGVALASAVVFVIVLAQRASNPDAPPEPGPFVAPTPAERTAVFDVEGIDGGTLTVSGGAADGRKSGVELNLPPDGRADVIETATASDIKPGDWITVIGVPNEVKNFSIRSLLVLPMGSAVGPDQIARSRGGFTGAEVSRDQKERPILSGVVESIEGNTITLRTNTGAMTITLTPTAPLRLMRVGGVQEIRAGDRVALHTDANGQPDTRLTALVLAGGAK
jgi:hypothetical protein